MRDVVFTEDAEQRAADHLLRYYRDGQTQEELCFALWRPSTGTYRLTAIVHQIIEPQSGDRMLHGNASFQPAYLDRAFKLALAQNSGLAFMHSHPNSGWQSLSALDETAERDVLAYPAQATGFPLLGLTAGCDGYWSARFWERQHGSMERHDCAKVRVPSTDKYRIYYNDAVVSPPRRREVLRRTYDTWGVDSQNDIARLRVGIVGLGSVGAIVAEAVARLGITQVTLIDHDTVKQHNLDRLLNTSVDDIGRLKVDVAAQHIRQHSTADPRTLNVVTHASSIHDEEAYRSALDCDVLFSCVDNAIARETLNYVAVAHLIPVIDGGVHPETLDDRFFMARWRAHIVNAETRCLRCVGQYDTSRLSGERQGLFDDPSYNATLPAGQRTVNENVFPFSLAVAAMEVNLMLRYCLALRWWPTVQAQDYEFVSGQVLLSEGQCRDQCEFRERVAQGDNETPYDLVLSRRHRTGASAGVWRSVWQWLRHRLTHLSHLRRIRRGPPLR